VFVSVPTVPFIGSEFEFTISSLPLYEHTHPDLCKGKNNYTMEYTRRWSRYMTPLILNLGTGWKWVVNFTPWPLHPGEGTTDTHWIRGWVDPRAKMDILEKKFCLCWKLNPISHSPLTWSLYWLHCSCCPNVRVPCYKHVSWLLCVPEFDPPSIHNIVSYMVSVCIHLILWPYTEIRSKVFCIKM
jgi:hypothetical protein